MAILGLKRGLKLMHINVRIILKLIRNGFVLKNGGIYLRRR